MLEQRIEIAVAQLETEAAGRRNPELHQVGYLGVGANFVRYPGRFLLGEILVRHADVLERRRRRRGVPGRLVDVGQPGFRRIGNAHDVGSFKWE